MLTAKREADSLSVTSETAKSISKSDKIPQRSAVRRTHRACDRCRVKKSKCNGQQPCNACKASERTCVFSALRRRDIRKWHCHMQDTVDEAIQRLYRACRESENFPGVLPDEKDGYVTTESILQGMGFSNLDLGPRAAGLPASRSLPVLPPRTYFHQNPGNLVFPHPKNSPADHQAHLNSTSDASSSHSTRSASSPGFQPEQNISPTQSIPHQQYPPHGLLHMPDQFDGTMDPSIHLRHHPHHYQNPNPQEQQQQQQLYQLQYNQNEQQPSFNPPPVHLGPSHVLVQPQLLMELGEQYPMSSSVIYDSGEAFHNPQHVWHEQNQMMMLSQ